jgi:hypothetical protein
VSSAEAFLGLIAVLTSARHIHPSLATHLYICTL